MVMLRRERGRATRRWGPWKDGSVYIVCPSCRQRFFVPDRRRPPYVCPHCGAKLSVRRLPCRILLRRFE
jgi:predicted RNA-binding Zn-ribbon protein involved in translation (DUF1610 family)